MRNLNLPLIMMGFTVVFLVIVVGIKYLISESPPDPGLLALITALGTATMTAAGVSAQQRSKEDIREKDGGKKDE